MKEMKKRGIMTRRKITTPANFDTHLLALSTNEEENGSSPSRHGANLTTANKTPRIDRLELASADIAVSSLKNPRMVGKNGTGLLTKKQKNKSSSVARAKGLEKSRNLGGALQHATIDVIVERKA